MWLLPYMAISFRLSMRLLNVYDIYRISVPLPKYGSNEEQESSKQSTQKLMLLLELLKVHAYFYPPKVFLYTHYGRKGETLSLKYYFSKYLHVFLTFLIQTSIV